jgi:hypothetical protein
MGRLTPQSTEAFAQEVINRAPGTKDGPATSRLLVVKSFVVNYLLCPGARLGFQLCRVWSSAFAANENPTLLSYLLDAISLSFSKSSLASALTIHINH